MLASTASDLSKSRPVVMQVSLKFSNNGHFLTIYFCFKAMLDDIIKLTELPFEYHEKKVLAKKLWFIIQWGSE